MHQKKVSGSVGDRIGTRTVTLTGQDLRDATRLLDALTNADEGISPRSAKLPSATHVGHKQAVDMARESLRRRVKRAKYFGHSMFGEPGWDMLLTLYTGESETRFKVSDLVTVARTPASTGLRWLSYLEDQQLVTRRSHPTDGRVGLVDLTDKARRALDSYFSETLSDSE
jgi:DNA-binding MarR family transcriptional regulator